MLWLCIHLPQLPLEVFSRGTAYPDPSVIVESRAQHISLCNASAMKLGIQPGMKLGAARALVADLCAHTRDLTAETQALQSVAIWVGQYSSFVSLSPPQSVLLEVQGSLVLFRNLESLLKQIREGIKTLGYTGRITVAPTPMASLVLARADAFVDKQFHSVVIELSALQQKLGQLSLKHLDIGSHVYQSLTSMGVNTISDCLRLPRDGLAKRFGLEFVNRLDRLIGKLPDPQLCFVAPDKFYSHIELPFEVKDVEALLFALHRLFVELGGYLRSKGAGIQQFDIEFKHQKRTTHISLGLLSAGRDIEKLNRLARERLQGFKLSEPVLEISLRADAIYELAETNTDFFGHVDEDNNVTELLERLCARLGQEAIHGIYPVSEHRPEQAWRYGAPGEQDQLNDNPDSVRRPLWLLNKPLLLRQQHGKPLLHGYLKLNPDRERIESGWWDGGDVQRDYFIAEDNYQSRYWIFRDLKGESGKWYLHGIFE